MKRDLIAIRTENRETYLFTSGAISKIDMIRARREIVIERVFTRPDGRSNWKKDILPCRDEQEWMKVRHDVLCSTGLMAYLEDSTQSTHTEAPAQSRRADGKRLARVQNLWAALRARLNIRRKDG